MCDFLKSRYRDLKVSKKIRCKNKASRLRKIIFQLRNALEEFLKALIRGFDINFNILNHSIFNILDVEFIYDDSKLYRKNSFLNNLEKNLFWGIFRHPMYNKIRCHLHWQHAFSMQRSNFFDKIFP